MGMRRSYRVLVRTARGVRVVVADAIDTCLGLPRLTPLEQTAPCVLGAFDLRGELVPVLSLGMLCGESAPVAAVSDLVLVVLAGAFPIGLHSSRPLCIEPCRAGSAGHARPDAVELRQVRLTVAEDAARPDAERRLARFERGLSTHSLSRLEQRACRYGDFAGSPPPKAPAPTPAQHW